MTRKSNHARVHNPPQTPLRRPPLPVLTGTPLFLICAMFAIANLLAPTPALAQQSSAVYLDDAPAAEEAFQRAESLAAIGNTREAVEVLQRIITTDGDRVVRSPLDPALSISLRDACNAWLLRSPAALQAYRQTQSPAASAMLTAGGADTVERDWLLTTPGFDAALAIAQEHLENARFEAAWLTLSQLDIHPDRVNDPERAQRALDLLTLTARYAGHRPDLRTPSRIPSKIADTIERWSPGANPPAPIEGWPELDRSTSAMDNLDPARLADVLSRPLASRVMGEPVDELEALISSTRVTGVQSDLRALHAMPSATRDAVYTNDSRTVSSWSRITLEPRWPAVRVNAPRNPTFVGSAQGLDDVNTVVVREGVAVALMGLSLQGRGASERVVLAIDDATGEVLWTAGIQGPASTGGLLSSIILAPELDEALIRGAPVIEQGTVILSAVKQVARERILSAALFGLDLRTGELKWVRPMGSIGLLTWGWGGNATRQLTAHDGLVYRVDAIGTIACIEAATGRLRWLRVEASEAQGRGISSRVDPWLSPVPLLHDRGLFVLSPNLDAVLLLNPDTGEMIARTPASNLGSPQSLIAVDGAIVGVSSSGLFAVPAEDFGDADRAWSIHAFRGDTPTGRITTIGDRLAVPTRAGLKLLTLTKGPGGQGYADAEIETITLNYAGQVLPLDGQILVTDDRTLHSYADWSVAQGHLLEQMLADERDPAPAITYAELAYQAGQSDALVEAIDRAIAAIAFDPFSPRAERSRERLFSAIRLMLEPPRNIGYITELPSAVRGELVTRLQRAAGSHTQRAAYLLAAGQHQEDIGDQRQAIEMYQRILDDPNLTEVAYLRDGLAVPAGTESSDRIRQIVLALGRTVYAPYDRDAQRLYDLALAEQDAAALEAVARRYPLAIAAPLAWRSAAERYTDDGREALAIFALVEARRAATAGAADSELLTAINQELIQLQLATGRLASAADLLNTIASTGAPFTITLGDQQLSADQALQAVTSVLTAAEQRPTIGTRLAYASALEGWVVPEPLTLTDVPSRTDAIVLRREVPPKDDDAPAALRNPAQFTPAWELGVFAPSDTGDLQLKWAGARNELPIRFDAAGLLTLELGEESNRWLQDFGAALYDPMTGKERWRTQSFREIFPIPEGKLEDREQRRRAGIEPARIDTPLKGLTGLSEIIFMLDGTTLVLVERTGRAVGIDTESGELLWTRTGLMDVVHDADARAGLIVLVGGNLRLGQTLDRGHISEERNPAATILETRTGQTLQNLNPGQATRWCRVTPEMAVIFGLDGGLWAIDASSGRSRWRNDAPPLAATRPVIATQGRILITDPDYELRTISTADGAHSDPLDTRGRLGSAFQSLRAATAQGNTVIASTVGTVLHDPEGKVVGFDARPLTGPLVPAVITQNYFIQVDARGGPIDDGNGYPRLMTIHGLESGAAVADAIVMLPEERTVSVGVLDGFILVSSDQATTVIAAPTTASAKPAPTP